MGNKARISTLIIQHSAGNSTQCSKIRKEGDFPGSPVVKTSPSNAGGVGSIPGWGAKIPHGLWPKNQNIKIQ